MNRFAYGVLGVCAATLFSAAPFAASAPISIYPLGDSITNGYPGAPTVAAGGYRDELNTKLAGKSFTFVGTSTSNASAGLTASGNTHHDGHSGYTIGDIDGNLTSVDNNDGGGSGDPDVGNNGGYWLTGNNGTTQFRAPITPNIVLLHIGTNDASGSHNRTVSQMDADLTLLLSHLKTDLPNAQIFVASLVPRTDDATRENNQESYNFDIQHTIVPNAGTNFHFVDMHAAFEAGNVSALLQSDGVHPSTAGYQLMGDTWFNAIGSYVPEPSSLSLLAVFGTGLLRRRRSVIAR